MSIYINLNDEETKALEELAREERRTPGQQAAWLVVNGINQRKAFENLTLRMEKMKLDPDDVFSGHPGDPAMPPYTQAAAKRIAVGEEEN